MGRLLVVQMAVTTIESFGRLFSVEFCPKQNMECSKISAVETIFTFQKYGDLILATKPFL
jgi:hypothetical protein